MKFCLAFVLTIIHISPDVSIPAFPDICFKFE